MKKKSKLFIISGPAGVGQGTIIKKLLEIPELNLQWVKGYTTRAQRESDQKEQKYNFVSIEEFKALEKNGEIFESTFYNNNFYGTSKSEINKVLKLGHNAIRDVDPIDGQKNFRHIFPNSVLIFITANLYDIKNRLINRGQNTAEEIDERTKFAKKQIEYAKLFDYIVENPEGHPEKAVEEIERIIQKEIA